MTPTAPPARRPPARRPPAARRRAVRRRRMAALTVLAGLAALALAPLLRHAVRELTLPLRHQDLIRRQARAEHLDPALIAAVIFAETKFVARTSSAGARGLMQIEPATARFLARRSGATSFRTSDLSSADVNIAYGSYYLRYLLDRYGGNAVLALAAYNGGEANVERWIAGAPPGRGFGIDDIPFPETRAYVRRVLAARVAYRAQYRRELGLG